MLLEKLKYFKEASKMTFEEIAEDSKTPLSTVKNIFSGKSEPLASTLYRISKTINAPLEDLLADSNIVLSHKSLIEVKENAEVVEAERDYVRTELEMLRAKTTEQEKEILVLKERVLQQDRILSLIDYFSKIKPIEK